MKKKLISIFILCTLAVSTNTFSQIANNLSCDISITIGSGRTDGRYHRFIDDWSNFATEKGNGLCIKNRASKGSLDNLQLIEKNEVDFALAQNDIGHHAYFGLRGSSKNTSFSGIKALYKEYVQIVYKSSNHGEIHTLSDLSGKTIAMGDKGSGGYWNGLDILNAAGLQEGFSFKLSKKKVHPIEALKNGDADVAIYTSASIHNEILKSDNYSFIELPISAAKRLSVELKKPYYDHGVLTYKKDGEIKTISAIAVQAYLVASNATHSEVVEKTISSLENYLTYITTTESQKNIGLEFVNKTMEDLPFDMHYLAGSSFGNRIFATIISKAVQIFLILLALLVMYTALKMRQKRYSSIGLIQYNSFWDGLRSRFIIFSQYMLGFALWLSWLWVVASVIVHAESEFAHLRGIDSPLQGIGMIERVSWLIRTSFTTLPGAIPLSPTASFLVPLTVIFGLGAFIYPVIVFFSAKQARDEKKQNGSWDYEPLSDHVIICGWNERVPGVILSLISEYTPKNKKIVLIAETEEKTPLVSRGIDPKRVYFIRGNAADTSILKKASAGHATEALVMACPDIHDKKNINSILRVVALRKLADTTIRQNKKALFIGAELLYEENTNSFFQAGVDSVIDIDFIINKTSAADVLSPGVGDYITDCLTFDEHFEIYSKKISSFPEKLKSLTRLKNSKTYSFNMLRQVMTNNGFQLLGYSPAISEDNEKNLIIANNSIENIPCSEDDRLVYFSIHKNKVYKTKWLTKKMPEIDDLPPLKEATVKPNIAIIGNIIRAKRVEDLLSSKVNNIKVIDEIELLNAISEDSGIAYTHTFNNIDSVLILNHDSQKNNTHISHDSGNSLSSSLDTAGILIVKFLNDLRNLSNYDMKIIAEIKDHSAREIFSICGADDVVIKNVLLERLLAKMVFNHGKMYSIISHLLTLDDGVYLSLHTVKSDDQFIGKNIKNLMLGQSDKYQICGWLPLRMTSYLQQNTMGTISHYVTAFNNKTMQREIKKNPLISEGDKLVILKIGTR